MRKGQKTTEEVRIGKKTTEEVRKGQKTTEEVRTGRSSLCQVRKSYEESENISLDFLGFPQFYLLKSEN